jgi:hypothetical protein
VTRRGTGSGRRYPSDDWPFDGDHPSHIIVNLAVGGWIGDPHPPPEDLEPQRLLVDYVRVFRRASQSGT